MDVMVDRLVLGSVAVITSKVDELVVERVSVNRGNCAIEERYLAVPAEELMEGELAVKQTRGGRYCPWEYQIVSSGETFESCARQLDADALGDDMRKLGLLPPQWIVAPESLYKRDVYEVPRDHFPAKLKFAEQLRLPLACSADTVLELEILTSAGDFTVIKG
ncbi:MULTISPECIES: hypothetical protein [unclassified Luteimonas]|uniref:hypothetical protein n=1 Tax=unclassified Luteimonas TaxID=2629088 RepID=UPI0011A60C44|nr:MULTISPECIES: hypothetical protein [unclassified Luteimonas]